MIVTVFRWRLLPGALEQFATSWEDVTRYYLERGSLGSAIFRDGSGVVWAIARWPDEATRDAAFADPAPEMLRTGMIESIEERLEPVELEALVDLWAPLGVGRS